MEIGGVWEGGMDTDIFFCPPCGLEDFDLAFLFHVVFVSDEDDLEVWGGERAGVG